MRMIGPHGHVTSRPDGYRARCGGPKICKVCMKEQAALDLRQEKAEAEASFTIPSPQQKREKQEAARQLTEEQKRDLANLIKASNEIESIPIDYAWVGGKKKALNEFLGPFGWQVSGCTDPRDHTTSYSIQPLHLR